MKDLSYQEAFAELQKIIEALQEEMVDIDELTEKSKRAAFLIKYCSEKLRQTESEIKNLFDSEA
jgi:exodeoxyribonuclease VII small subunit